VISIGRHLGTLLLGTATTGVLLSGLAVALPAAGLPGHLASALGTAVRAAAIVDDGPQVTDPDTVAAPISRLRTVPRAVVAAVPVSTTPPAADPATPAIRSADQTPAPRSAAPNTTDPTPKPKKKPAARGPVGAVVAATNAERAEAGCDPVRLDSRLSAAAQGHASDMAANDYFSHTDQDGGDSSDRMHDAGFSGSRTGENIAYGQETGAEVVATWMDSSGHRHNILNCAYDRIGVGYDARGDYWVQDFGG
jgi:uncharacterized protein YkwD